MGTVSSSLCQNMPACGVPLQMWQRKLPLHLQPRACSRHYALKREHPSRKTLFITRPLAVNEVLGTLRIHRRPAELWSLSEWEFCPCSIFCDMVHEPHGVSPLGWWVVRTTHTWTCYQTVMCPAAASSFLDRSSQPIYSFVPLFIYLFLLFSLPHTLTDFKACCFKHALF